VGKYWVLTPQRPGVMGKGCGVRPCGSVPPGRDGKRTVGELAGPTKWEHSQGCRAGTQSTTRAQSESEPVRPRLRDPTEGALCRWSVVRGPPD